MGEDGTGRSGMRCDAMDWGGMAWGGVGWDEMGRGVCVRESGGYLDMEIFGYWNCLHPSLRMGGEGKYPTCGATP